MMEFTYKRIYYNSNNTNFTRRGTIKAHMPKMIIKINKFKRTNGILFCENRIGVEVSPYEIYVGL